MQFLVFQLQSPLSSWGEVAVGEYRGTAEHPSQSALIGLLGAALGIDRQDEEAHARLRDGYAHAVGILSTGGLLRDYHTVQVPPRAALKNRPHATRRDELSVPKEALGTIVSTRDYRQDAASLVALQPREQALYPLEALAAALRTPRFVLSLGRKSCPPAAPLWPQVIDAASAKDAMDTYRERFDTRRVAESNDSRPLLEPLPPLARIAFDEHVVAGVPHDLSTRRKDRLIRRAGWQFGDRTEHLALMEPSAVVTDPENKT